MKHCVTKLSLFTTYLRNVNTEWIVLQHEEYEKSNGSESEWKSFPVGKRGFYLEHFCGATATHTHTHKRATFCVNYQDRKRWDEERATIGRKFPRIKIMAFLLFYRLSGHQFHRIRIWCIRCRMEVSSFIHFQQKNIAMKFIRPFTGKLSSYCNYVFTGFFLHLSIIMIIISFSLDARW